MDRLIPEAHGCKSAFTLVELLVVISIIALLIALLLPALTAAKETARLSVCLSNERQLAIALSAYSQESKEWWPVGSMRICGHDGTGGTPNHDSALWATVVAHYTSHRYSTEYPYNATQFPDDALYDPWGPKRNQGVLKCPSENLLNWGSAPLSISYGYNEGNYGMGVNDSYTYDSGTNGNDLALGRIRSVNIPKPSRTILLGDEDQPAGYEYQVGHLSWGGTAVFAGKYHFTGRCNLLYADGHAATKETAKLIPDDFDRYK